MRTALLILLLLGATAPEPPTRPPRPTLTIPIDGDDIDTYGIPELEQACFRK